MEKEITSKVPGASIAVAVNGAAVWQEFFGLSDMARNLPVTARTRFRIGSVSKSLAAAALALLVERGQIEPDVPIQTYIPDFPQHELPITVRLLAGHLSGIRDYRGDEALSTVSYTGTRSRLKIFESDPLIARPGEKFKYSSFNWDVIEAAMESATHQDFVSLMQANLLRPLSLDLTCAEQPGAADDDRTQFYETNEKGAFVPGPRIDVRYAWAMGGYLSTAGDLVKFGSALLHPGFLRESSLKLLFTSQKTTDGTPTNYGMGWNIYPAPKVIYHSGWTVGGLSILLMLPDDKVVVAIVTNRGGLNISDENPLHFDIEEVGFKIARFFAVPEAEARSEQYTNRRSAP